MAKVSLAVCLMLLVALNIVYPTEGSTLDRLRKTFPKMSKDFEPYAHKGMLEFIVDLESVCPMTPEFKYFFKNLKGYIDLCFKPKSSGFIKIEAEMSMQSKLVSRGMYALSVNKNIASVYYWNLISSLVSMQRVVVERKKISPKEILIPYVQEKKLYRHIVTWVSSICLFVQDASKTKGKTIDLSPFGINSDVHDHNIDVHKRSFDQAKGAFSLPLYLKDFPKIRKDFEPFAYKGMLEFARYLDRECSGGVEFNDYFAKLNDYMAVFKSASPNSYSPPVERKINEKSTKLFIAMSALNVTSVGTYTPWKHMDALLSMGNMLVEMKKNGSKEITFEERRDLTWSMVKWARAVINFVSVASAKQGVHIDTSSFDNYYKSNVIFRNGFTYGK